MTDLICDDPDDWDEAAIDRPRPWRPSDRLDPAPTRGWIIAYSHFHGDEALDIGCWLHLLFEAQHASEESGVRSYHVSRRPNGSRVLLVHPSLKDHITETIWSLNSAMTDCTCGGMDCIEGELQERATKVIARRKLAAMPLDQRLDCVLYSDSEAEPTLALASADAILAYNGGEVAYEICRY